MVLVLPIDAGRSLLVLSVPVARFRDRAAGVRETDRDTGAPVVELTLALTGADGAAPQVLRVSVPEPGVPANLAVGSAVRATGLTLVSGEKNGLTWQMFKASALTAVKA